MQHSMSFYTFMDEDASKALLGVSVSKKPLEVELRNSFFCYGVPENERESMADSFLKNKDINLQYLDDLLYQEIMSVSVLLAEKTTSTEFAGYFCRFYNRKSSLSEDYKKPSFDYAEDLQKYFNYLISVVEPKVKL